ncbi:MAG TPA: phosphoadenylyl-sulfate reductase, partial [Actinomycetales bacterium]|nr:phosphoadenylyl-sulfate reductase [Actinomycetales bacterium]
MTRTADQLRAVVTEAAWADDAPAEEVIAWAAGEFGDHLAVACSMADAVLPHRVGAPRPGAAAL